MKAVTVSDVGSIATSVWESLDPLDPLLLVTSPANGDAQDESLTSDDPTNMEEMAALVILLKREIAQSRRVQAHLQQELHSLKQQLEAVPAYLLRLEQRHSEVESRLAQLDQVCGIQSATVTRPEQIDLWLSVREVAGQLSLSESTIRRYIRQGKLPATRLPGGRGLRLLWPDVQQRMQQVAARDRNTETT